MKKLIIILTIYFLFLPNLYAIANKTKYSEINNENGVFDIFRSQLVEPSDYLVFLDNKVKMNLLIESDYNKIGGKDSYINNRKETLIETSKYITKKGEIEEIDASKTYYTKAIVYVGKVSDEYVKVTGSGSQSRPYKFSNAFDLSIIKMYQKDNEDDQYSEITSTPDSSYELNSYDCKNRAFVEFNDGELVFSDIMVPVSCTFWFKKK